MVSPVRGFRPTRALRGRTSKVPNPTRETFSPLARAFSMLAMKELMARSVSFLVRPVSWATLLIRSALFIQLIPPHRARGPCCSVSYFAKGRQLLFLHAFHGFHLRSRAA